MKISQRVFKLKMGNEYMTEVDSARFAQTLLFQFLRDVRAVVLCLLIVISRLTYAGTDPMLAT